MNDSSKAPGHEPGIVLSAEEKVRQQRRSRAIGLAVAGLVALFYLITIFKMGPGILDRPL
jgi:hypothetical protein